MVFGLLVVHFGRLLAGGRVDGRRRELRRSGRLGELGRSRRLDRLGSLGAVLVFRRRRRGRGRRRQLRRRGRRRLVAY
jgi:hypothetical protein